MDLDLPLWRGTTLASFIASGTMPPKIELLKIISKTTDVSHSVLYLYLFDTRSSSLQTEQLFCKYHKLLPDHLPWLPQVGGKMFNSTPSWICVGKFYSSWINWIIVIIKFTNIEDVIIRCYKVQVVIESFIMADVMSMLNNIWPYMLQYSIINKIGSITTDLANI